MKPIQIIEVVSHPSRWAILKALKEPKTPQDIAAETGLSPHNVIYHSKFLVDAGLLRVTKDPEFKSRQVYHRKPFLAEIVVDYESLGKVEVTFHRGKRTKAAA